MILSERRLGPAQRRGYGEYSENLIQRCDTHDIIPCTKTTERPEALGRARERATVCATPAAFNAVWRLQNRNRIAGIRIRYYKACRCRSLRRATSATSTSITLAQPNGEGQRCSLFCASRRAVGRVLEIQNGAMGLVVGDYLAVTGRVYPRDISSAVQLPYAFRARDGNRLRGGSDAECDGTNCRDPGHAERAGGQDARKKRTSLDCPARFR